MLVRDKKFYRDFFTMTMTIALQNLIVYGVNLADNIMLGAYSETALSGVAIANQVQFLLQMVVTGTASGMGVIISQYWGKRQTEPIKRVFAVGFWISLLLSAIMSAIVWFVPYGVMGLLTNEQSIIPAGVEYLKIMVFSYLMFSISNSLLGVMRSVETVRIGFYISLSTLLINICLNYTLIYGHFGAPELGVKGAAYATLTSRAVEFIASIIYCRFIDKKLKLRIKDVFALERSYIADFMKSGVPLLLSNVSWGVAMSVQAAILGIEHLGRKARALLRHAADVQLELREHGLAVHRALELIQEVVDEVGPLLGIGGLAQQVAHQQHLVAGGGHLGHEDHIVAGADGLIFAAVIAVQGMAHLVGQGELAVQVVLVV